MRGKVRKIARRVGYRGLGLLTFTATCWLYGAGLIAGYHPTFFSAFGLSTQAFGWAFVGVGAFAATGVLVANDRVHYSICVLAVTSWVLLLSTHWTAPFGWTAAVSWMSVAAALIIASAWPEPIHKEDVQDRVKAELSEVESKVNGSQL